MFGRGFAAANGHRLFACSPTPVRSQHAFIATEKHPRKSRPRDHHAENACPLGTSAGDRPRRRPSAIARLLAKYFGALARAPDVRKDQRVLHACGALSVTHLDGTKPRIFAHGKFSDSERNLDANFGSRRVHRRSVRSSIRVTLRSTTRVRFQRSITQLADAIAENIELVVFDRSLLW